MSDKLTKENLLEIEKGFWHNGADYYNRHITAGAVFVFPGMVLSKKDGVAAADQAPRWDELEMNDKKIIELSGEIAILTYHATGKRKGSDPYKGNITTIYRMESGRPKMAFHQHTPDPPEENS